MYVGIDQSLNSTGLALLDGAGGLIATFRISPPPKFRQGERLRYIFTSLVRLVESNRYLATGGLVLALEGYSYRSTGRTFELGEVGGVIKLAHATQWYDAPLHVVTPAQLKKFVTGDGHATKEAMCAAIQKHWGVSYDAETRSDEADAYGLARVAFAVQTGQYRTRAQVEVVNTLKKGPRTKDRRRLVGRDV